MQSAKRLESIDIWKSGKSTRMKAIIAYLTIMVLYAFCLPYVDILDRTFNYNPRGQLFSLRFVKRFLFVALNSTLVVFALLLAKCAGHLANMPIDHGVLIMIMVGYYAILNLIVVIENGFYDAANYGTGRLYLLSRVLYVAVFALICLIAKDLVALSVNWITVVMALAIVVVAESMTAVLRRNEIETDLEIDVIVRHSITKAHRRKVARIDARFSKRYGDIIHEFAGGYGIEEHALKQLLLYEIVNKGGVQEDILMHSLCLLFPTVAEKREVSIGMPQMTCSNIRKFFSEKNPEHIWNARRDLLEFLRNPASQIESCAWLLKKLGDEYEGMEMAEGKSFYVLRRYRGADLEQYRLDMLLIYDIATQSQKQSVFVGGRAYSNSQLVEHVCLSPNFSDPRMMVIDRITPHCTVGHYSMESLGERFSDPSQMASSNYGIGQDGRVALYVEERNRSWCSSNPANDGRAVTVECSSEGEYPYELSPVVYCKLIELCTDICWRNQKRKLIWLGEKEGTLAYSPKKDEMILTVHRWFCEKSCPGDWLFERLGDLADEVTERLSRKAGQ